MHRERWPANTRTTRPVDTPVCIAVHTALGAEFDALKNRLEHCRDLIERALRLLAPPADTAEQDAEMFEHGPQGAD